MFVRALSSVYIAFICIVIYLVLSTRAMDNITEKSAPTLEEQHRELKCMFCKTMERQKEQEDNAFRKRAWRSSIRERRNRSPELRALNAWAHQQNEKLFEQQKGSSSQLIKIFSHYAKKISDTFKEHEAKMNFAIIGEALNTI